jgi:glycosyltransferase involved in cell wall biosynthesis
VLEITKAKTKLTVIGNTLETFGGGERWLMETAVMLKDTMDITIINPVSPKDVKRENLAELRKRYKGSYKIVDVPCSSRHVKRGNFLMMFPTPTGIARMKEAIRNADVVYELSMNPLILWNAIVFSRIYGKRLILDMGNPLLLREDKLPELKQTPVAMSLQRLLFSAIRELHVQTESQVRMIKKYGYKGKTYYIPHFTFFKPGSPSSGSKDGKFRILFVGRLDVWQKGIDLLAKVIRSALKKDRALVFDLVGSGEGKNTLKELAAEYKKNVRYHGFVPDETLNKYYGSADLFIITSRYETPGLSLLEAQSYGIPAVGFDVQGPNDIVKDRIQGMLVKPFNTEKFTEAIISEKSKTGGRNARKRKISELIQKRYSKAGFKRDFTKMIMEGKV